MKTNAQITSIECFHGRVQADKEGQYRKILAVMAHGIDYTGQELSHMTGYPPNIISARLFELREDLKAVKRNLDKTLCPHSHVRVFTHRKMDDLFASIADATASHQAGFEQRQEVTA